MFKKINSIRQKLVEKFHLIVIILLYLLLFLIALLIASVLQGLIISIFWRIFLVFNKTLSILWHLKSLTIYQAFKLGLLVELTYLINFLIRFIKESKL